MHLSVAGAAKAAQVQNDILLSDFTRNLVVVGRQPHPDPNFASYVSLGAPIALLWRFRELPEEPLRARFLDSRVLLLRFFLAARLWPSLCCCVLFTAAFLLQSF